MDEIDDINEQYERRNRARELNLKSLAGDNRFSSRNQILASIETAWIMGVFRHAHDRTALVDDQLARLIKGPTWTDEVARTLAAQTHSNALATWLSIADMEDRIRRIEVSVNRLNLTVHCGLGILIGIALLQFGWW